MSFKSTQRRKFVAVCLAKRGGYGCAECRSVFDDAAEGNMAKDGMPRLRAPRMKQPLHIVLVDPEIPQNTGNIGRLAAALQCPIHLVGQLGFRVDDKAVRRAQPAAELKLFSAVAERCYLEARFNPGDALVFGRESSGLPQEMLDAHREARFALPTIGEVRSLNLANTVAVVLYEALRQLDAFEQLELR